MEEGGAPLSLPAALQDRDDNLKGQLQCQVQLLPTPEAEAEAAAALASAEGLEARRRAWVVRVLREYGALDIEEAGWRECVTPPPSPPFLRACPCVCASARG